MRAVGSRTEDQVLAATKITQSIATGLLEVIESLRGSPDSDNFKEPVRWKELGLDEYPLMIKRPRDLGTVEARLLLTVKSKKLKKHPQAGRAKECGRYGSVLEFFNDIEQIWQNCLTCGAAFNDVSSDIAHSAMRMRATSRTRKDTWIHKMVPELVKDGSSPATAATPSTSSEKESETLGNGNKSSGAKRKSGEKSKAKKDGTEDKRKRKSRTALEKSKAGKDHSNHLFIEGNNNDGVGGGGGRNKKRKMKVLTGAEGTAADGELTEAGKDVFDVCTYDQFILFAAI
ncbi:hypothetical protein Pmar_PMAR005938 [Perkinsus marinus ATCC 50983]|uniref:Bromo domain-containing protein n=1 Tax=Perkinsus marinus (strain ATCC 50983 / TXsc) TaxID=423536 RepID=C5LL34_PERM5|nr:hypothetical protein Pmar_PMAR005938 [Perkinsus marinus ATCC 50983]EER02598.1 hypothetical protein Pmar_PMAR005938 [Perkinsus marinus ATCC 50983]|eukprot:XP_002769880.1 hypothetical protein Pmar_PMAR005938 [Perkinsus marinus ATCC 50983]